MKPQDPVIPGWPVTQVAKDQPQYQTLPAINVGDENGTFISRWKMSWTDRLRALFFGDVYLQMSTFGQPLQPVVLHTDKPDISMAPEYANVPEILKPLIDGLDFQSESNCIWALFVPAERRTGAVTEDTMVRLTGKEMREPTPQDHRTFGEFFVHHCDPRVQPMWQRYITLRDTMSQLLTSLQVFRMSGFDDYNLTYYVVGIDSKNNIIGIFVGATET